MDPQAAPAPSPDQPQAAGSGSPEGPAPQHPAINADGTLALPEPELEGLHPNAQKVALALAGLGVAGQVRALPEPAPTAATAAAQLGVGVGAIANSLVFDADGAPLLVLTSGAHRADTVLLAAICGAQKVSRATPDFVRSATGQPIGGVAPVGHPAPLRTVVDVELSRYDVVWAAGGHPHYVFPTTYDELLRITAGEAAEVGEQPG